MAETVEIKRFGAKRKYPKDIGTQDFYKHYISTLDSVELENGYKLDRGTYNKVFSEINQGLQNYILDGNSFKMLYKLGTIMVIKKEVKPIVVDGKLKNVVVDWASTRKLWKEDEESFKKGTKVYFNNDHTDKFLYRWYWNKKYTNFTNTNCYKFIAIRKAKRKLKDKLNNPQNKVDFYNVNR